MVRFIALLVGLAFAGVLALALFGTVSGLITDPPAATAEHEFHKHPKELALASDGPFGKFDNRQVQRGLQVYKEVCAACHSLRLVAFRDLKEIGYSDAQVKAFAASYDNIPSINPDAAGTASGVILFIAVFGAVISYMMQMVSFVVLRRKFPNAQRPYKSPTGIAGAVVAGIIAFAAFIGIVTNAAFSTAVVTFLVIFVVGLIIFSLVGRHRLVLSPEEEYALSGGLKDGPEDVV